MSLSKFGRAFLLGTSALVMTSTVASAGSFDITVDTVANQTLNAGETGIVQAGVTLSGSTLGLPTVDIVGSGATLTNLGTIMGSSLGAGVGVRNPITGVTVTNSGTIFSGDLGFGTGFSAWGADISGGVHNSGTISGELFGIRLTSGADISDGLNNSGLVTGGSAGINLRTSAKITGGIENSGTLKAGSGGAGIVVTSGADINFTNNLGLGAGVVNRTGGLISGIRVRSGSDISGGVINQAGGGPFLVSWLDLAPTFRAV